jgi:hypothetical protein
MADEITTYCSLAVTNGQLSLPGVGGSIKVDQTTARGGGPGAVTIGTSEEAISFGDIGPGYIYMRNLDDTNYIEFGPESGGSMVVCGRLKAGEQCLFRLGGSVTLRAQANTAAVDVLIYALSD